MTDLTMWESFFFNLCLKAPQILKEEEITSLKFSQLK